MSVKFFQHNQGFKLGGNAQPEDHRPTDGAQGTKPEAAGYEGLFREGADYQAHS